MGETHPTPAENTSALSAMLEGRKPTDPGNDIDDRMAALHADHVEMGARPAVEPSGDTHASTYPLEAKADKPAAPKKAAKKASKSK